MSRHPLRRWRAVHGALLRTPSTFLGWRLEEIIPRRKRKPTAIGTAVVWLLIAVSLSRVADWDDTQLAVAASPPDRVTITGSVNVDAAVGLRASGVRNGVCVDYWSQSLPGSAPEANIESLGNSPGCLGSVAAFQSGAGAAVERVTWSDGTGEGVSVQLGQSALKIPVIVWIAGMDDFQTSLFTSRAYTAALEADAVYDSSRTGVGFQFDTRIVDGSWEAKRIASAALSSSAEDDCGQFRQVCSMLSHEPGVINVYFVPELESAKGWACRSDRLIAIDGTAATPETLRHELGHLAGLDHVATWVPWPGDDQVLVTGAQPAVLGNVMCVQDKACGHRDRFTLGQAFWANVHRQSIVKRHYPSVNLTADCKELSTDCPGQLDPRPEE